MGDIHGSHRALEQCLERSKFNYDEDTLIQLGDVADGWKYVYECVNILLGIRNLIQIRGNHDDWFIKWIETGVHPDNWRQGGYSTAMSYLRAIGKEDLIEQNKYSGWQHPLLSSDIEPVHRDYWLNMKDYYKDDKERIFIHGGFDRHKLLKEQLPYVYWWDRDLWSLALSWKGPLLPNGKRSEEQKPFKILEPCSEIFIGHTTTNFWDTDKPMHAAEKIWNLDTGAGWAGRLTIMDVDTKEYWQSDLVTELYKGETGRG